MKKYICVAKCPELDYDNSKHCVTENPNQPFPLYDYDCPCGNCPKWEEIQDHQPRKAVHLMRERLVELIVNADTYDNYDCKLCNKDDDACDCCFAEKLADNLLANGVIVPPVKVGQTVWVCNHHNGNVYENRVDGIYITGASGWKNTIRLEYKNRPGEVQYRKFAWKQIGKTVFLTREEAERALKGEQSNA